MSKDIAGVKNKYCLSHSPCRKNKYYRWFKSIKDTNSIGGEIVANAYGKTKEIAEERANQIVNSLNNNNGK